MTYLDPVRDALIGQLPGLHPELLDLYTLLAFTRGEQTTREDVHDAWVLWIHRTRPDHPSLVPFSELTPEIQELDELYVQAIRTAAEHVGARST